MTSQIANPPSLSLGVVCVSPGYNGTVRQSEVKPGREHSVFLSQLRQREALVHMLSSQSLNK